MASDMKSLTVHADNGSFTFDIVDQEARDKAQDAIDMAQGISGFATEEWVQQGYQPKGDYLESDALDDAIDKALAQAKESGEFDGSDLPAVTADNNGAFLRVVDGTWAAVSVANAEEESF